MISKLLFSSLIVLSVSADVIGSNGISYYDMEKFNIWPYMRYDEAPFGTLDETKFEMFFKTVSQDMKAAKMDTLNLSFSQVCDIANYFEGNFKWEEGQMPNFSQKDVVGMDIWQIQNSQEKGQLEPSIDLMKAFVEGFHKYGIKVNLSFGGADASLEEFVLGKSAVVDQVLKLVAFLDRYQIDGVDFDIETTLNSDVLEPLKELFQGLKNAGKKVSLTLMMSLADWPNGCLRSLFYDELGNRIFDQLFDGLNFMAYSETDYYLDADSLSWGVKYWIDIIGKAAAGKIRFGFYDHVPYEGALDRSLRGEKAAFAYKLLIQNLQKQGYPTNFSDPFWWPAEDGLHHHYDTPAQDGSVTFVSEDQVNFYRALECN